MADLFGEDDDDLVDEEEEEEEEDEQEDILEMDSGPAVQQDDALLMRFCPHDSSMLYPQVRVSYDEERKMLLWHER